jgi:RNA polymerase sigma factor (sigma-70 family)
MGRPRAGRLTNDQATRLVKLAVAGEESGWSGLHGAYDGMISAIARSHRLSEADAADVSQATWVQLFTHIQGIREPSLVRPWLVTTARRESLRVCGSGQNEILAGDDLPETPVRAGHADGLIADERHQALERAFASLKPRDRALIKMLIREPQPSYEDISRMLEMPVGSIGPTRARILNRLREAIERAADVELLAAV